MWLVRPVSLRKRFDDRQAEVGQFQRAQVFEAEPQHRDAEAIVAVLVGALQKAERFERLQQTKHRRARNLQAPGQFRRAQYRFARRELGEDLQTAFETRHLVAGFGRRSLVCRRARR